MLLTNENVTGGINTAIDTITVVNSGSEYDSVDTLTLQQIGSTNTGSATLDAFNAGDIEFRTPGPIREYPSGIMNAGSTVARIAVIDSTGNELTLSAMLPGVIRPFVFSTVLSAGTTPEVGQITIFYN